VPVLGACAVVFLAGRWALRSFVGMAVFDSRPQVFVVGNEAADVDSLVSAYTMAQLLDGPKLQAIALAQIPREEFHLRGDAVALFREAGSKVMSDGSPSAMMFWDEVPWDQVDQLDQRSLVLVDHNKMTEQVALHFDAQRVTRVLDHHAGGIAYPDASNLIDESLGSCCSLVVEQYASPDQSKLNQELGVLLAGAILLDCRNFDKDAKKGTPRDVDALNHLKSKVQVPEAKPWYKQLMEARKDVSHLTIRDLMLLDTKVVTLRELRVAVASMFCTLSELRERSPSAEEVQVVAQKLAKDRGWDAVVLLFSKDKSMGKRRALAFVPMSVPGASELCRDIVQQMRGTPSNLPRDLAENPLFQTQGLVETGFQVEDFKDMQPLDVYTLKGDVSRKTVLPFAHMVAKS